ncbi:MULTISPECIES: hypothetical protein [unclassified Methylobacterium]|uniref:hypothetical protein n=1 Tax=unclassified Methylobacterium TaxID=2615210 RepID=UPI001355878B|nr:hypothetical protein [Methylobacterium sp. 2A]MWV20545.1 hypothetical protein [Methylobacterium sp. 2A]
MSTTATPRIVIVGGGPAGRAALTALPGAVLIARPDATAWHAEPGRLWVEGGGRVWAEPFDALLVCADEPLLLAALGCAVRDGRVVADAEGRTGVPGVSAAGCVAGATTPETAERQAIAAARALAAGSTGPEPLVTPPAESAAPLRLDPVALAALLEQPAGSERDRTALAQHAILGAVVPARPVSLAALADLVATMPEAVPPQADAGVLA